MMLNSGGEVEVQDCRLHPGIERLSPGRTTRFRTLSVLESAVVKNYDCAKRSFV